MVEKFSRGGLWAGATAMGGGTAAEKEVRTLLGGFWVEGRGSRGPDEPLLGRQGERRELLGCIAQFPRFW